MFGFLSFLRLENRLVNHYFAFSKSGSCGYAGALAFRSKFSKLVFCLEKFLSFSKMHFPKSCVFGKEGCFLDGAEQPGEN